MSNGAAKTGPAPREVASGTPSGDLEAGHARESADDGALFPGERHCGQHEEADLLPRPYWQPTNRSRDADYYTEAPTRPTAPRWLSPSSSKKSRRLLVLLCSVAGIALLTAGWISYRKAKRLREASAVDSLRFTRRGLSTSPDGANSTVFPTSFVAGWNFPYPADGLVSGHHGAVASEAAICSDIGVAVLKDNGSAVDAAIASGLCTGVVNSFSSGIGGGGFMTIRLPDGKNEFIDFRETAPAASTECMFCADPKKSQIGGLAVGVPGELAGYELAHQRHGRLPWARLVQPSVDICERGYEVTEEIYSRMIAAEFLLTSPGFRELFTIDDPNNSANRVLKPKGSKLVNPKLAKTLRAVAADGARAFYTGDIAQSIVRTVNAAGGILTLEDMREYKAILRPPLVGYYRGRKVITGPPPSSGAALLQMLNILEGYDLAHSAPNVNVVRMVEAAKWGFAARTELGDTDFINITSRIAEIVDKGRAGEIRAKMKDDQTFTLEHYSPKYDFRDTPGTSHTSVLDKDKMAVAVTSTINLGFGARLMDEETGVILNNEMDDFSSPNVKNYFGILPSKNNFIRPGKRPVSSVVPTILERDGRLDAAYGGSGGSRIITAVFQGILNVVDFGMDPYTAVASPRWHHQLVPEMAEVDFGFPRDLADALVHAGHNMTVHEKGYKGSEVQIVQRLADGRVIAASDPRKHAKAAAY